MLSKVLKKSTCADCRFCCSFRRQSLWETPLFPKETMDQLESTYINKEGNKIKFQRDIWDHTEYGRMNLLGYYKTDDPEEEVPCEFLDPQKGCVLTGEDKPFDCRIWPLRIMRKDNQLVIALTPTCPSINQQPIETMERLVNEDGLGKTIYDYAKKHPYMIKEYKEGFPILQEFPL